MCLPEERVCRECGSLGGEGDDCCPHCGGEFKPDPTVSDGSAEIEEARAIVEESLMKEVGSCLECSACGEIYDPREYGDGDACPSEDGGILKFKKTS